LDFVERWHKETNNFHLPFKEMIVTLDDILLHLSIVGQFCPNEALDFDATLESVINILSIERSRCHMRSCNVVVPT